jgi:hypothetical protein
VLAQRCSRGRAQCSPSALPLLGHQQRCLRWGTGELHAPPPTSTPTSSSIMMSLHSSKQQGDIALESAYCKHMFQVFKMFQRCAASVSHRCCNSRSGCCNVAMAIHIYFKCRFQMFYLFQTYVASVSSGCCKSRSGCCIYMTVFQMFSCLCCMCFHLDVFNDYNGYTRGFQVLFWCFVSVSDVCCKCFNCLRRMMQMFLLDVAKVDLVLHMLQWDLSAAAACYSFLARQHGHGCGGVRAGNRASADQHEVGAGYGAVRDIMWAQDTERRRSPHEAGTSMRHGCPDASPRPDVRA